MSTAQAVPPILRLNAADNVAIARTDVATGTALPNAGINSRQHIRAGHKIALTEIGEKQPVYRYGQIIGFASRTIAAGEHVHIHNMEMGEFERDYAYCAGASPTAYAAEPATFAGFVRDDGRAATRNYIAVISSVNCSATAAHHIANHFRFSGELDAYPNIDGVVAITHGSGCGMADSGPGFDTLKRVLQGYASHANFAAVVMIGLGCEVMQLSRLLHGDGIKASGRLHSVTIQQAGGTRKAIDHVVGKIRELLPEANQVQRQSISAAELCVALQCGGSDGYSGITANPALGAAVDRLVRHGGTAILSETPEIYGAEHLLTRRAASREIGEKLIDRIHWWEDYTRREGAVMNNNPSPGNKAGGITTIIEKSLGAIAKSGSTNLVDVYEYAHPVTARGFVYMDTPGYDPVAATGQIAGGANLMCFTTGRGSAFGSKPTPSIKLATNTALYERQTEDMDINCGDIITGSETVDACGERIFQRMLAVASGERTCSEGFDYGDNEFVPWQLGATM